MEARKIKHTALYERLSRDDEQQGESNSITNQKMFLEDYARAKGFKNIRHYTDDGYSGTNFDRPGFQEMIADIEAGEIDTVCVKDLSRLGRNYLKVGFYTEILFQEKNVRFIAINNGVDSINPMENDFTPFLNIMNEWYAKDTSNKIKAVFKSRMQNGKRCSGAVPYGYYRDPEDKDHFLVDEGAAEVIRHIFQLALEGKGVNQIRDILNAEHVLIPSAYTEQSTNGNVSRNHNYYDPYMWSSRTVGSILDRREYVGDTILGKTVRDNFKTKKRRATPPDEWIIFKDTHEAIIDRETWENVNRLRKRVHRASPNGSPTHPLSGLLYCHDCGGRLSYRGGWKGRENGMEFNSDYFFKCSRYISPVENCTSHYITASAVTELVEDAIRKVAESALDDEAGFLKRLKDVTDEQIVQQVAQNEKELTDIRKRLAELDNLIQTLYERNTNGSIPERQFQKLLTAYDQEQEQLEQRVPKLEKSLMDLREDDKKGERFLRMVRKYRGFEEITPTMINEFIDRVVVHEATGGRTRYRSQEIEIYFNFIGNFKMSEPAETEEERIARIDAEFEEKRKAKSKATGQRATDKRRQMRELAKTDPEVAKAYEEKYLKRQREMNRKRGAKDRELMALTEEDLAKLPEPERQKAIERIEYIKARRKKWAETTTQRRNELKELAKTDEVAEQTFEELKAKERRMNQVNSARKKALLALTEEDLAKLPEPERQETIERIEKERARRKGVYERKKARQEAKTG